MVNYFRESDIVKKAQRSSFKLHPLAAAIALAMTAQFAANVAYAGSGFGKGIDITTAPVILPTYYANSPVGPVPAMNVFGTTTVNPATGLPLMVDTGKALRKFVDTLPGMGPLKANNLGQYIPVAVPEKWVDLNGVATADDYYEIAAIEFTEKMHSDLPKATHLRGYVQLSTATNPGLHIALKYPNGSAILDAKGVQVYAYDNPHHLGPIISSTKGTAVRVKFTNYLPVGAGGELFIPVDTTVTGAGMGPDNLTKYTQNRAEIHLVGGRSPWISAGTPHQWVAPAGEVAAYAAGIGKGASAQNVPDMADPGNGSTTLYFPNDMSARFMFYQDRTSGITRLNSYAGLEAGYVVTDPTEQGLIASGVIPAAADTIPLIIEDKTFVPNNIAQQDAKWDTAFWGQPGDLWFPHVYEVNQDSNSITGFSPVGRWDFGPLYWPIFPASAALPTGIHGDASSVSEAFLDTPVINGTAYPTLTVDPKAYRFRILNASNDRYLNLSLFKADPAAVAPQLDRNGNPIVDATGVQQYFTNTEVKMIPAVADAAGNPVNWVGGVQMPLPQYPMLKTNINVSSSGPSRAWPTDQRAGGMPDPTTTGPDFIVIGNDGGLLPNPVDVPAQPVTYELNRRSITIGNIYGYGLLLGPAERADAIVDFSAYAGQTLIVYNDAPAQNPWNDPRNDYYTGSPDQTDKGGSYSTNPGYGPNTRTMMQIKVNAAPAGVVPVAYNATALVTALPKAYGASQPQPIVPATAYNAAFATNNTDIYAHVATGTQAQPTLDFATAVNGGVILTQPKLVTSGGTPGAGGVILGNATPGSGSGYDPLNPPTVIFNNTVNGVSCLSAAGVSASANAVVDATTRQVTQIINFNPGSGYTCAPTITFATPNLSNISDVILVTKGGSGYTAPTVSFTGGGGTGAAGNVTVGKSAATITVVGGSGYTAPTVQVSGGGVAAGSVTGAATVGTSAATVTVVGGSGYVLPTVTVSGGGVAAGAVTATATVGVGGAITGITLTPNAGFTSAPTILIAETSPAAIATATGASATATVLPIAGSITGVTLTPNAGFTSAPTILIADPNPAATGAIATAKVLPIAGVVTGVSITNGGTGYTSAPSIKFADPNPAAAGAIATAQLSKSTGVGAQATVGSTTMTSYAVLSKAEQELFDAHGRYNFTGGVELPMTNAVVQTTVPLNYTDSATEIIGDNEVQIWKLVDNGFWANPIHFDTLEVQLINRVGWDGTIKPPASTELGWKDTITLNQLEDAVVAVRARRPSVPFGLPQSKRSQDPSLSLGAAGTSLTGGNPTPLRFTADPGVTQIAGTMAAAVVPAGTPLLTTTVNTAVVNGSPTHNYDNELAWGSTSLGHAENDFNRPVVFNPTVIIPNAPTSLAMAAGTTVLTWVDPTPAAAAATLANPQNEIGFKILRATLDAAGNAGPFTQVGTVPANVTSWTEPAPVPNQTYEVIAYNAAGNSVPSLSLAAVAPAVPAGLIANPIAFNSVTLNWAPQTNTTKIEVMRNGVLLTTLPGTATTFVDTTVTPLQNYTYQLNAVNAFGSKSSAVLPVATPMEFVAAPIGLIATPTVAGTSVQLSWTDMANNETAYWVDMSVNGGVPTRTVIARTAAQTTAINNLVQPARFVTVPGNNYTFVVTAVSVTAGATSTSAPATAVVNMAVTVPTAPTALGVTLTRANRATLTWMDNANNETAYLVSITNVTTGVTTTATVPRTAAQSLATGLPLVTYNAVVALNNNYTFSVVAQNSRFGLTAVSTAAGPIPLTVAAPAAPTAVNAVAGAPGSLAVTVNWTDAPVNATSYTVLRATVTGGVVGAFARVGTVLPGVQTFVNTGLRAGRSYQYSVVANGGVGSSAATVSGTVVAQ
jgi:FtsP/CotA-like multicopper oxidase with cupredoxin domain